MGSLHTVSNLAAEKKDFYFGGLDARRVLFLRGRTPTLAPNQDKPPYTGFDRTLTFVSLPEPAAAHTSAVR